MPFLRFVGPTAAYAILDVTITILFILLSEDKLI